MSTFIDVLFGNEATPSAPFRCMNSDWKTSTVSHPLVKSESWPVQHRSLFDHIYFEGKNNAVRYWVLGEIYSYKRHRLVQGRMGILNAIGADLSVHEFDPVQANGHFIAIVFDKTKKTLRVYTDRLGTYHLYYGTRGNKCALGTFFKSVVHSVSATALNHDGLLDFFSFGFFLEDSTYFRDVTLLKPSSVYVFDDQLRVVDQSVYWKPVHYPTHNAGHSDILEAVASCLQEVTADLTAFGKVAIPISGGLDSRTMAGVCTLRDLRKNDYWSYSYGYSKDSAEISIARRIARARDLPFYSKVIGNYLFDNIDPIADSVELFQYIDGTRQADITGELAAHSDFVIAAHWGDVWFDNMGYTPAVGADLASFGLKKFMKKGSDWFIGNLLKRDHEEAHDSLKVKIKNLLRPYEGIEDMDFRIKMLKTFNWSFRWTLASIRMFQPGAFPRLPFYDNRIVDLFSTLPTALVGGRKLQIEYLKKYHPDLATITWQEYDANLYNYPYFNNRMLPYRVLSKLKRMARGTKTIMRNWEIFYLNQEGKKNLESALLNNERLFEFVTPQAVRELIAKFYSRPNGANGYTISMLHTFSVFLSRYFR